MSRERSRPPEGREPRVALAVRYDTDRIGPSGRRLRSALESRPNAQPAIEVGGATPATLAIVAGAVAGPAADTEFINHGATARLEIGLMVELEELARTAINTTPIAFQHHAFLSHRWVPMPTRCVDGPTFRIVNQCADETRWRNTFQNAPRDRCPIIERRAITTNDLCVDRLRQAFPFGRWQPERTNDHPAWIRLPRHTPGPTVASVNRLRPLLPVQPGGKDDAQSARRNAIRHFQEVDLVLRSRDTRQ